MELIDAVLKELSSARRESAKNRLVFRCRGLHRTFSAACYTSLDPATSTLEVAVHKGFRVLDTEVHILTSGRIIDPKNVHVVEPHDVPNPNWLSPCTPNRNQQEYGDKLLANHQFVLIPSAVSRHSWNLIFEAKKTMADYTDVVQERFALDPRLQSRTSAL